MQLEVHEGYSGQIIKTCGFAGLQLIYGVRRVHRCTIGECIRRLRVERACRQLSSSDESLATIAANTGFSDQSHFSRTFKRLVGMTQAQSA